MIGLPILTAHGRQQCSGLFKKKYQSVFGWLFRSPTDKHVLLPQYLLNLHIFHTNTHLTDQVSPAAESVKDVLTTKVEAYSLWKEGLFGSSTQAA